MNKELQRIWRIILTLMLMTGWLILPGASAVVKAEAPNWSVLVTATTASEGSNPNLAFGTNSTATDGYDSNLDIPHPPPSPSVTLAAYFQIVDALFPQLDKDYRAPASSVQWTLVVTSNSEAIDLSWDTSGVPANTSLSMTETGLDVDMKTASSTQLASGSHTLTITASTAPIAVTTVSSSGVSYTQATLNGNLDSLGIDSSVLVSFVWGETQGGPYTETGTVLKSSPGAFSANLSGLSPNTTYYFKAKATGTTTAYGSELNFTTPATVSPTVTTRSATRVGATMVTLNGNLDSLGSASTANVSFIWGITPGSLTNETTPSLMNAPGAFSFKLPGLSGNTTYYYNTKAVGDGISNGDVMSVTTLTSGCFIATAAYGSFLDPHLDTLRGFRDRYLITNDPGQDFVNFYYTNSPPIANYIAKHSVLRSIVRVALVPLVLFSDIALKITLIGELAIIGFLIVAAGAFFVWFRRKRRQKMTQAR